MVKELIESICALLATLFAVPGIALAAIEPTPAPLREINIKTGITVYANDYASIDASNLSEGFILASYTGGSQNKIKLRVIKDGGSTYTYNLSPDSHMEIFPISEGDGLYTVKVFEQIEGNSYATVYAESMEVALQNEFIPFLSPNQYVNFTNESDTVAMGLEITKGIEGDLDKVAAVFDWVVDNFTYDYDKAATVKSGYLPVVDEVLASKTGICFDYAAVMAAMLRSQNIPCKLVVGYVGGETYHAWINVYVQGVGWIDQAIYFNGENWTMMEPTFTSTNDRSEEIMSYVTNNQNYEEKFVY